MKDASIYENLMMTECFNRFKMLRNNWNPDKNKGYGLATIMDIGGADYRSYSFLMEKCESILIEMIPTIVSELLKAYNYSPHWYSISREDAHVYYFNDDKKWGDYVPQSKKQRVFAFSCDDEAHKGILYVFKKFGIRNHLPKSLLEKTIEDNELSHFCYISLVEDKAYSEIINHNNDESDPSRGTGIFSLKLFFDSFFDEDEYTCFKQYAQRFTSKVKDYFGFEIVKTLKPNTLHNFKKTVRDDLLGFEIRHEDIDRGISEDQYQIMKENFFGAGNCELLNGTSDFAQSYMTAEWLFSSLSEAGNIDLTAIAMGYFKAIEQLLFRFIGIHTYENDGKERYIYIGKGKATADDRGNAVITEALLGDEYITKDINLGALTGFFGYYNDKYERYYHRNKDLLADGIDDNTYEYIVDTLSGIVGLRNGYFHKHNLEGWDKVLEARYSSRLVFFLILGAYTISENDKDKLGIIRVEKHDDYYRLCDYMNKVSYSTDLDIPIFYLNGQKEPYGFWTIHPDSFIEYDTFGEPIYSGIYFGQFGDKRQFKATRENLPEEIWEGVLSVSRSVPIQINPSGPQRKIYAEGRFVE